MGTWLLVWIVLIVAAALGVSRGNATTTAVLVQKTPGGAWTASDGAMTPEGPPRGAAAQIDVELVRVLGVPAARVSLPPATPNVFGAASLVQLSPRDQQAFLDAVADHILLNRAVGQQLFWRNARSSALSDLSPGAATVLADLVRRGGGVHRAFLFDATRVAGVLAIVGPTLLMLALGVLRIRHHRGLRLSIIRFAGGRCPICGYPREGVADALCPECGSNALREFDDAVLEIPDLRPDPPVP